MAMIVTERWQMNSWVTTDGWIPVDIEKKQRTTTKHETVTTEEPVRLYWQMEREPLKPLQMRVRRGRLYD